MWAGAAAAEYWLAMAYVALLVPARARRGASLADQIGWTACYAVGLWRFAVDEWYFASAVWPAWILASLICTVLFSRRVVFGSRRFDLAWYGGWCVALTVAKVVFGRDVPVFDRSNRPMGDLAAMAGVLVAFVGVLVVVRDVYKGYLPWCCESRRPGGANRPSSR